MRGMIFYSSVLLFGTVISSFSQILLKKSATKKYNNLIREYFNVRVILSYSVFILATFCTMYAYKGIPLSMGPILASTEYIFVAVLSYFILKEKISKQKWVGLLLIILGIAIFSF